MDRGEAAEAETSLCCHTEVENKKRVDPVIYLKQ